MELKLASKSFPSFGMVYPRYFVTDTARGSRGRHKGTRMGGLSSATTSLCDLGQDYVSPDLNFLMSQMEIQ